MTKNNIWDILDEMLISKPYLFGIPVKDELIIDQSENMLDVKFSDPYRTFLEKYGGIILSGHVILGLLQSPENSFFNDTIISKTTFFKKEQVWPKINDWYIISDDGSGNPIGIDPDGQVWLSDHNSGFEHILLASNFNEFILKLFRNTLYE